VSDNALRPPLQVSVAICTWNRSALLRQTLDDVTRLEVPEGVAWEVLVVNNNCTDDTPRVLEAFAGRLPLRVVFERKQGLSSARNAAVREARGAYIAWTDDDVRLEQQWLAAYVAAFRARPDAAFFGGPIHPEFEREVPPWLAQVWSRVATAYGERALGPDPIRFDGQQLTPFGANYAVRADVQRHHPYDTRLGRRPGGMVLGEEIALAQALIAEGLEGWWVPDARVRHFVPAHQMNTRYLRRYFRGLGQTLALMEPPPTGPMLWGRPRALWRAGVEQEYDYWVARVRKPPEKWIRDLIVASITWGRLLGP